jgi:hypothetical protein
MRADERPGVFSEQETQRISCGKEEMKVVDAVSHDAQFWCEMDKTREVVD